MLYYGLLWFAITRPLFEMKLFAVAKSMSRNDLIVYCVLL